MKRILLFLTALTFSGIVISQSLRTERVDIIAPNAPARTFVDVDADLSINGGIQVNAILDEDNMVSDSATALSTQQATKAYVDSSIAGSGDVVGPASSVDSNFAFYDSTTGKLLKDLGISLSTDGTLVGNSDLLVPTEQAVKNYVDTSLTGYVDLTTNQSIAGEKSFTDTMAITETAAENALNISHDGTVAATTINQSGSGLALDIVGDTELAGDSTQTGTSTITGSAAIDNITIDGNEISSTDTDGNISLNPDGDGEVVKVDGNANSVILGENPDVKELLQYPSFEGGFEGTGSGCTASLQDLASTEQTPLDKKYLQLVCDAGGTFTITAATGAGFAGQTSQISCEAKTSLTDATFEERRDGADGALVTIDATSVSNVWSKTQAQVQGLMPTTSVGYKITAPTAGTVNLNNCTINTKDNIQAIGYQSDPTEYLPTNTQGFGTLGTNTIKWSRDGAFLLLDVNFIAGSVTGDEAQIELPDSLVIGDIGISGDAASIGTYFLDLSGSNTGGSVLATTGDTFVNFGNRGTFGGNTTTANSPAGGSSVATTGAFVTFQARIPIQGWTSGNTALSVKCDGISCENIFTAKVSAAGAISLENHDWLSTCTGSVCNFKSGVFSELPNCEVGSSTRTNIFCAVTSLSTTSIAVDCRNNNGSILNSTTDKQITCVKTGADFNAASQISATLQDVVKSPGAEGRQTILLNNRVDASEAITSPIGDSLFVSSCTDAAPSVCTLITTIIQGSPDCWAQGASSYVSASDATTVTIERSAASTPFSLFCKGLNP